MQLRLTLPSDSTILELPETMLRDAGMTKELVQGYTMQRKHMETNRRFVSKNTGEGAGTQRNLLATGGSLNSIPEMDDEVPYAIC